MLAATYAAPAAWAPAAAHDESLRGESTAGVGAAVVGVVPPGEAEPSGEAGDAPVASGGGDGWDFGGPRTVARVSAISRCFAAQDEFDVTERKAESSSSPMGPTGTSRLGPPSRVLIEPRGSSGEGVHAAASKERGGASEGGKPKSTAAEQQQAAGTPPPQGEAALREALSALPLEWLERAQAELESRVRLGSAGLGRE